MPRRVIGEAPRVLSAWAASVIAHGALVGAGALMFWLHARTSPPPPPAEPAPTAPNTLVMPDSVDLFVATDGTKDGETIRLPFAPALVPRGGGDGEPRPDSGHAGRGGTDTAEHRATNLADRNDGTYLSP